LKFERKFLLLSFFIFFILQSIFVIIINQYSYKEYKYFIKDEIKQHLEICSYKLNCNDTNVNFVAKKETPFKLIETPNEFYMLFAFSYLKKYYLKISINKTVYTQKLNKIKSQLYYKIAIELVIVFILSIVFTLLLFIPLKQAYDINETFIKDILHDLNTPLSTLKLNIYLLTKEIGKTERIQKIEQNLKNILIQQNNLKSFLTNNPNQKDIFNIQNIIDQKLQFYSNNYPLIKYSNKANLKIKTNKAAFDSIMDNLISNAFKYNKKNGEIKIYVKECLLYIQDTGKGIKNTNKIFNRFYKEQDRGIGIGMSIVKKLCNELNIPIKIQSVVNEGTTIILDLKNLCYN